MTQNHLVHLLNESENLTETVKDDGKQNKCDELFSRAHQKPKQLDYPTRTKPETRGRSQTPTTTKTIINPARRTDLLFEEDRQFWTGVLHSHAPITTTRLLITCNDESLIPTQDMSLHAILRYQSLLGSQC